MKTRTCRISGQTFYIREEDEAFYEKMGVPLPTLSPQERFRRRAAWRNERGLHIRTCDKTGKPMLSAFHQDSPYTVYNEAEWWKDDWDAMDHGQDFDFNRPFFEQFKELLHKVPRRGLSQDGTSENSEYTNYGMNNKNGYLLFTCFYTEDCLYSRFCAFGRDYVDCLRVFNSELMYECIDCNQCYNCAWSQNSYGCQDSYLLEECRNCKNCIACKNLVGKEYHIYNKPVSKEEFEAFKAKLFNGGLEEERKRFEEFKLTLPTLSGHQSNCDNCFGDFNENAKDCFWSFDIIMGAENMCYCQYGGWKGKDIYDATFAGKESELCYEAQACVVINNCISVCYSRGCNDTFYSESMFECQDCFGCTGLKKKRFCIFNKKYSESEYHKLKNKIIAHMKQTGEWGEFFPTQISMFPYNETLAFDALPLTKEQALARGYKWLDPIPSEQITDPKLPKCSITGKAFRLIPQELEFYKKMGGLPIPTKCPDQRYKERVVKRNPHYLWQRKCAKTGQDIWTSYSPERPETLYSESAFFSEIY